MPHSQSSKCDHLGGVVVQSFPWGEFRAICGICMLVGPISKDYHVAESLFWEQTHQQTPIFYEDDRHIINTVAAWVDTINQKETTVSTTDYKLLPGEVAYRKGVEDATKPFVSPEVTDAWYYLPRHYNVILENRRKELLTRKVTKYFFLYKPGNQVSCLYDTEELAYQASLNNYGKVAERVFGGITSVTYDEPI